mgnify:FL=1
MALFWSSVVLTGNPTMRVDDKKFTDLIKEAAEEMK